MSLLKKVLALGLAVSLFCLVASPLSAKAACLPGQAYDPANGAPCPNQSSLTIDSTARAGDTASTFVISSGSSRPFTVNNGTSQDFHVVRLEFLSYQATPALLAGDTPSFYNVSAGTQRQFIITDPGNNDIYLSKADLHYVSGGVCPVGGYDPNTGAPCPTQPSITIITPNGGDRFVTSNVAIPVIWTENYNSSSIKVHLYSVSLVADVFVSPTISGTIAGNIVNAPGKNVYTIPIAAYYPQGQYQVSVCDTNQSPYLCDVSDSYFTLNGNPTRGSVSDRISPNTPATRVVTNSQTQITPNVVLGVFSLKSSNQNGSIDTLSFNLKNSSNDPANTIFQNVRLVDGSTVYGASAFATDGTVTFTKLNNALTQDIWKDLVLESDIAANTNGTAYGSGGSVTLSATMLASGISGVDSGNNPLNTSNTFDIPANALTLNSSPLTLSNPSALVGTCTSPFGQNDPRQSCPIMFSFVLANSGNNDVYINKTPSLALHTLLAGPQGGHASIVSVNTGSSQAGDTSGAYIISSGSTRIFSYYGTIDNLNTTVSGIQQFQIYQIDYGSTASAPTGQSLTGDALAPLLVSRAFSAGMPAAPQNNAIAVDADPAFRAAHLVPGKAVAIAGFRFVNKGAKVATLDMRSLLGSMIAALSPNSSVSVTQVSLNFNKGSAAQFGNRVYAYQGSTLLGTGDSLGVSLSGFSLAPGETKYLQIVIVPSSISGYPTIAVGLTGINTLDSNGGAAYSAVTGAQGPDMTIDTGTSPSPTPAPSATPAPTVSTQPYPTAVPTAHPTAAPSVAPTVAPTNTPYATIQPTVTTAPVASPYHSPSPTPTPSPTMHASAAGNGSMVGAVLDSYSSFMNVLNKIF